MRSDHPLRIFSLSDVVGDCGSCPIRFQAMCSRCNGDELAMLDKMKSYRTFAKGEAIAYVGEELRYFGTLVSGIAEISQGLEDGRRQIMGILMPSDFVGWPYRRISQFDVNAVSEVVMCRFDMVSFERLVEQVPSLGSRLLEMTMDELDAARAWMMVLGQKTAREKMASLMYIIALRNVSFKLDDMVSEVAFELPLTRKQIADYIGLTLETVSRQISALKSSGIIAIEGQRHIIIKDPIALHAEAGDLWSKALPNTTKFVNSGQIVRGND